MRFYIFANGKKVNTIVTDENFCKRYCEENNYTYSVEQNDIVEQNNIILTRDDEIDAMIINQEYRLLLVELGVNYNAI